MSHIELEDKLRVSRKAGGVVEAEVTIPELARLAILSGDSRPQACRIIFNRSTLVGREFEYMMKAMRVGHISGNGSFTRRVEALLESELGAPRVLLTTSCTHALEMAALLLDLRPGDEVIVPSFTFVSTANAFVLRGARPVFCDIRPDTLNLDERKLEGLLTPRTRAILPIHYGGVGCEMERILDLAEERGLEVVEDLAHGPFARYRRSALGTLGRFSALSFHETKNFTCGEGGALVLNEPEDAERAEVLREKGTNRSQFFRGQVDRYTWVDVGSSYVISDLLAAFLLGQLEEKESVQSRRRELFENYKRLLEPHAEALGLTLPSVPSHCESAHHLFHVLLPDGESRDRAIEALREKGILAVFHYLPLHLSPMGRIFGGRPGDCPVAEDVSARLLRLPFHLHLTPADQEEVVDALVTVLAGSVEA